MENMTLPPSRPLTFREQERQCASLFLTRGPFYHLCTPGESTLTLFETDDDFRFAMNLTAWCSHLIPDVNILTFEIMRTHLHLIGEGPPDAAQEWFGQFRKRMFRFYQSTGRVRDLKGFRADCFPVNDLSFLRNSITYVNRNGFLVYPEHSPYSYPWGANRFFFNPDACRRCDRRYGDLTWDEKRVLMRCRNADYPGDHTLVDGYVSPVNYCDLPLAEALFRDARHYFYQVSRHVEGYLEIARLLGDKATYTDDELYLVVRQLCRDRYGVARPETLPPEKKREFAHLLRHEYKASDNQIRRMLRMEQLPSGFGR